MYILKNSFSIVINGDWNDKYIKPSWITKRVFEVEQIEFEFIGQELNFITQIKSKDIAIRPSQQKVVIFCSDIGVENIRELERVFRSFLKECISPEITSYGLNLSFEEEDTKSYSKIIDSLSDYSILVDNGVIIESTDITRNFKYKNTPFTLRFTTEMNKLKMAFNSHYECKMESDKIEIDEGIVNDYVKNCLEVLGYYGYSLEEEE